MRKALLDTAVQAGLWVIPRETCRELLAACGVYGGGQEAFVFNERLNMDVIYAQKMLRIEGGETPDAEDAREIQRLVRECTRWEKRPDGSMHEVVLQPEWAVKLSEKYGFALL